MDRLRKMSRKTEMDDWGAGTRVVSEEKVEKWKGRWMDRGQVDKQGELWFAGPGPMGGCPGLLSGEAVLTHLVSRTRASPGSQRYTVDKEKGRWWRVEHPGGEGHGQHLLPPGHSSSQLRKGCSDLCTGPVGRQLS